MNRTKLLPEFAKPVRNRKKKEKMEGYDDLKPKHKPYKKEHHNYLLDPEDAYILGEEFDGE